MPMIIGMVIAAATVWSAMICARIGDLPPLKWSSLKYGFAVEDRIDGKEEAYS